MPEFAPFIAILLALMAALSVGVIAWNLSDDKFHRSFDQEKRHENVGRETDDA